MIGRAPVYRAARSETVSFAVIVDAKVDGARHFDERESFLSLPKQPLRLSRRWSISGSFLNSGVRQMTIQEEIDQLTPPAKASRWRGDLCGHAECGDAGDRAHPSQFAAALAPQLRLSNYPKGVVAILRLGAEA